MVIFSGPIMRGSVLAILIAGLLFVPPAHAHKVNLFAFVEGDKVFVEGYFTDGKRAQNSKVEVFDPDGELLVEGTTNDDGNFTFEIPQTSDLKISLNAGMGHRTEYSMSAAELGGAPGGDLGNTPGGQDAAVILPTTAAGEIQAMSTVDAEAISPIVRKAVGEALVPVMRSLSELKEQRTFSDIVGGIGFIVGVLGVFFYWKARRLSDKSPDPGA